MTNNRKLLLMKPIFQKVLVLVGISGWFGINESDWMGLGTLIFIFWVIDDPENISLAKFIKVVP